MAANRHETKSGCRWRPDPRWRTSAPQRRMALPRRGAMAAVRIPRGALSSARYNGLPVDAEAAFGRFEDLDEQFSGRVRAQFHSAAHYLGNASYHGSLLLD